MNYIQLAPGEKVILSCHTHWRNYVLPFVVCWLCVTFLLVRIKFFGLPLILNLTKYLGDISYAKVSVVEAILMLVLALSSASTGMKQVLRRYTVTNERLIQHVGFLNTETTELKLCYCSNLVLSQSLGGKILGYGDFRMRAGGVEMFFNDVPDPLKFKKVLTDAIDNAVYGTDSREAEETLIDKLEKDLGMKP